MALEYYLFWTQVSRVPCILHPGGCSLPRPRLSQEDEVGTVIILKSQEGKQTHCDGTTKPQTRGRHVGSAQISQALCLLPIDAVKSYRVVRSHSSCFRNYMYQVSA